MVLLVFELEFFKALVLTYGYSGAFLIGFLSSFTLFIPSPAFFLIFVLGATLNPILLGLSAGLGSTLGEMVAYGAGVGINLLAKKHRKQLNHVRILFNKYRPPVVIFIFAATPLPFDVVGIFAGAVRYNKNKFFLATLAGKIVKFTIIAYAGAMSLDWIVDYVQF